MNIQIKTVLGLLAATFLSGCACFGRGGAVAHNEPVARKHARAMLAPPSEVRGEAELNPVFFKLDSNELTPLIKEILRENAEWAANHPERNLRLEGNCDERGTTEYNLALGARRAQAAFDYLQSLGVASTRMTTVSYGEESPIDTGHNESAWAKNRRVETKPAQ